MCDGEVEKNNFDDLIILFHWHDGEIDVLEQAHPIDRFEHFQENQHLYAHVHSYVNSKRKQN